MRFHPSTKNRRCLPALKLTWKERSPSAALVVKARAGRCGRVQKNAVDIGRADFSTSRLFNGASAFIAAVLVGLYWYWW